MSHQGENVKLLFKQGTNIPLKKWGVYEWAGV
jgi:hypothetical protein